MNTVRTGRIENLARTLELPLLVVSVILFFFLFIYLDRGLKDDLLVMLLSPLNPKEEILDFLAWFSIIPVLTVASLLWVS